MKSLLKQSPTLVSLVRWGRALPSQIGRSGLRCVLSWANRKTARRLILYEALPERFAYAEHSEESYFVNTSDKFIGKMLYARGDFDLRKFEKAYQLIEERGALCKSKKLPVLVDIGANIGSICIPAVKRGLVSRAIAIEPDAENYRLLKINVLLNQLEGLIDTQRAAVGNERGIVSLSRSNENSGDHRVSKSFSEGADTVPMIILDSLADQLDLSNAILWMDIQGYEGFAISGARNFVKAAVPIVVEFTKRDLVEAGCFELIISELAESPYTAFFNLEEPIPKKKQLTSDTLRNLADELDAAGAFTDLLLLRE